MEKRFSFTYNLPTVDFTLGKSLPRSHGSIGGTGHNYITVPWKAAENVKPDPANPVSLASGWTFLYGPTDDIWISASVRCMVVQAGSSMHLRLYKVKINPDNTETRIWGSESPERFVGDGETHISNGETYYTSTHLDGNWRVAPLLENERLRLEVDYWTAVNPNPNYEVGKIVGARVEGIYWRDVVEEVPTV